MKQLIAPLSLLIVFFASAQNPTTPDVLWGPLFKDVQLRKVLGDGKTFVDALPKYPPAEIQHNYFTAKAQDSAFDLKNFVDQNFQLPQMPAVQVKQGLSLREHLIQLWPLLTRPADVAQPYSSLLPLPKPYVVPGGRFREIYYWDTYFTMQGLVSTNRTDLVEDMLDNFAHLVNTYGHIPNGNRSYYLSRSQPPYFSLMVNTLMFAKGDASVYKKYYAAMKKEYLWWMDGAKTLQPGEASRRVMRTKEGVLLNRYWDDKQAPREESYAEDVATADAFRGEGTVFTHLRAGAESGWDFSSRWFKDTMRLETIETTFIAPVDLNCLLYAAELILSEAATASGATNDAAQYKAAAARRKLAIQRTFWDQKRGWYFDYHFTEQKVTGRWSLAGTMPLFVQLATPQQAEVVGNNLKTNFLKPGGLIATPYNTGQQWDAPNGWAPLQYLAVKGLRNYRQHGLAQDIAQRWMAVNEKVFAATGKMLEKYNVENTTLESGGGEYPTQDGFGWTNGVYLKFWEWYGKK